MFGNYAYSSCINQPLPSLSSTQPHHHNDHRGHANDLEHDHPMLMHMPMPMAMPASTHEIVPMPMPMPMQMPIPMAMPMAMPMTMYHHHHHHHHHPITVDSGAHRDCSEAVLNIFCDCVYMQENMAMIRFHSTIGFCHNVYTALCTCSLSPMNADSAAMPLHRLNQSSRFRHGQIQPAL